MEILSNINLWILLGGFGSIIMMIYRFFASQKLSRYGVRVEGTVTDYWTETQSDDDGMDSMSYYLKVFFTDAEAYVHSVKVSVSTKVYAKSVESMAVNLVHPPGKPKKAKPDQASAIYGSVFIWGGILLSFAVAYLVLNWS